MVRTRCKNEALAESEVDVVDKKGVSSSEHGANLAALALLLEPTSTRARRDISFSTRKEKENADGDAEEEEERQQ